MAFTGHSDVFAAIDENAINATIGHLMLQRPSLFNYATLLFTQALSTQFCLPINVPPGGLAPGQPLFTVEAPLPVIGAPRPVGLDWCLQLNNVSVDLHPGNTLTLPPEIGSLGPQQFPDDISEWLSDLFNVSLGVFNLILQFVAGFFGKCVSFFQLDDPYPMIPKTEDLAEVTIPIQHLTATVSDVELVVTADIGAAP